MIRHYRGGGRAGRTGLFQASTLAAAALLTVVLLGAPGVGAGIIELGQKGQLKKGSDLSINVDGTTFRDPNSPAGTTAEAVLDGLIAQMTASGLAVTRIDPSTKNAVDIRTGGLGEPRRLGVLVDDDPNGIRGAVAEVRSGSSAPVYRFKGAGAVAGDGYVLVEVALNSSPGTPKVALVTTAPGMTAEALNAALVAQLRSQGLNVQPSSPSARGIITINSPADPIVRVLSKSTDSAATEVGVEKVTQGAIPALTGLGLTLLVLLMIGAAAWALRRTRSAERV